MSLSDMIKIARNIDFGTLYIKPAFVFVDGDGHVKLQFEADTVRHWLTCTIVFVKKWVYLGIMNHLRMASGFTLIAQCTAQTIEQLMDVDLMVLIKGVSVLK